MAESCLMAAPIFILIPLTKFREKQAWYVRVPTSTRSVVMFKIQHFIAPQYLIDACPPLVGEVSSYNLLNADNITLPMGRRTGYVNSFMPSAVRLWNGLIRDIKNLTN